MRACIFLPLVYSDHDDDDGDVRRPLLPVSPPAKAVFCLLPVCACVRWNVFASTMWGAPISLLTLKENNVVLYLSLSLKRQKKSRSIV